VRYTHLGRSRLLISRIGLGTMNFGPGSGKKQSLEILSRAVDAGVNLVDTADVYGWELGQGITERIIGAWLKEQPERRRRIVLASKVYGPMGAGPNERGLSAYHIRRACEESLRRMNTDHIDLYTMHHIDRGVIGPSEQRSFGKPSFAVEPRSAVPSRDYWDEIWQAMELLVHEGKVIYVGSSNFPGWHLAQACERATQRNFLGPVCEQSLYNLSNRAVEMEVLPACREYGLGFLAYSPLGGGMLAGALDSPRDTGRYHEIAEVIEKRKKQVRAFEQLCRELGDKPAVIALAWLLHRSGVTAPLVGPRTTGQLEDSLQALEVRLGGETLERLEKIWPGPGEAPEAYAW
jgi:aryl-alcohol dehydrogenase-like predicted oxidoreductase